MSTSTALALLGAGAALCYYDKPTSSLGTEKVVEKALKENKAPKGDKVLKVGKASKASKAPIVVNTDKLDTYILMIKGAKKFLKYNKKVLQQIRYIVQSGVLSIKFGDWIRSPKFVETMILLLGTIMMVRSNFKPFKAQSSLASKVTTIGGSLLTESKGILTMYQLMVGISDLAKSRKPPIRELSIAGAMILAGKVVTWYS